MTGWMKPSFSPEFWRDRSTQGRRLIALAREHVGAAGFEQGEALERLIALGREQNEVHAALKEVLGTLDTASVGGESATTLNDLKTTGEEQLAFVRDLHDVLSAALVKVTDTPVQRISAALLEEICEGARHQMRALEDLITETRGILEDPERQAKLDALQSQVQDAAQQVEVNAAQGQVESLREMSREAVDRIANVDAAPTDRQIEALEAVARAAQDHADALRAAEASSSTSPR